MAFITACCKRCEPLLLAALLLVLAAPAQAAFRVTAATPQFRDGNLYLSADMELELTDKVEEALDKGIPMHLVIDISLHRVRPWLWDETIGEWQLVRKLSYHALSGQYLLATVGSDQIDSYTALSQALRASGQLSEQEFPMNHFPGGDDQYELKLRVALDIGALPAPLRPSAYTSPDWRLNSGWSTWPARP